MGGALTLLVLISATVTVKGGSTCPHPAQVRAELVKLLDPAAIESLASARIEQSEGGVRIELRDASGALAGTRALAGSSRCADLAAASAVVIATWVARLRAAPPPPVELPAPPAPPQPAPIGPPPAFDFAVGVVGSYWQGFGLGALIAASLTAPKASSGGHLSLAAMGEHQLPVDGGVATWQRFSLGLGGMRRFRPGTWKVDLVAQALGALLAIAGDENLREIDRKGFDPGVLLGVRAISAPGLWVGAFATGWLKPEAVTGTTLSEAPKLPQFELFLAAGVAWGTE